MSGQQDAAPHAGDMYDIVHSLDEHGLGVISSVAEEWAHSKLSAQISAATLGQILSTQQMMKAFFPLMPSWDPAPQVRQTDEAIRASVVMWGLMQDALKNEKGAMSPYEKLRIWQEATTVPAPIGQTPKVCIFEDGIVTAYRYLPLDGTPPTRGVPIGLKFALMNSKSVWDLCHGHSLVEGLLKDGYDVYTTEWGNPTVAQASWNFETYALGFTPKIVDAIKRHSGSEDFSIMSWCQGSLISSMYAAMRPTDGLKNLVLLTAPLDFSSDTLMFKRQLEPLNIGQVLAASGNMMPGEFIDAGAMGLKPIANTIGTYRHLWSSIGDEERVRMWRAMSTWRNTLKDMPGGVFSQLAERLYLGNELVKGRFEMSEGVVDLKRVTADVLVVVADQDHIVPPIQSEKAADYFGGATTIHRAHGGHIGVVVGASGRKTARSVCEWLAPRSN